MWTNATLPENVAPLGKNCWKMGNVGHGLARRLPEETIVLNGERVRAERHPDDTTALGRCKRCVSGNAPSATGCVPRLELDVPNNAAETDNQIEASVVHLVVVDVESFGVVALPKRTAQVGEEDVSKRVLDIM